MKGDWGDGEDGENWGGKRLYEVCPFRLSFGLKPNNEKSGGEVTYLCKQGRKELLPCRYFISIESQSLGIFSRRRLNEPIRETITSDSILRDEAMSEPPNPVVFA